MTEKTETIQLDWDVIDDAVDQLGKDGHNDLAERIDDARQVYDNVEWEEVTLPVWTHDEVVAALGNTYRISQRDFADVWQTARDEATK